MAGLAFTYSEGFSPHPLISFAQPLSVGLESNGEYVDIRLDRAESSEAVKNAMNLFHVEGMWTEDVVRLPDDAPKAMASVAFASYTVEFRYGRAPDADLSAVVKAFLESSSCKVEKSTKRGKREIDLRPLTKELCVLRGIPERGSSFTGRPAEGAFDKSKNVFLKMCLSAESGDNVKPGLLFRELMTFAGIEEYPESGLLITREELFDREGRPLIEAGEHFG